MSLEGDGGGDGTPVPAEATQRVLQCSCCLKHDRSVPIAGGGGKPPLTYFFPLCRYLLGYKRKGEGGKKNNPGHLITSHMQKALWKTACSKSLVLRAGFFQLIVILAKAQPQREANWLFSAEPGWGWGWMGGGETQHPSWGRRRLLLLQNPSKKK